MYLVLIFGLLVPTSSKYIEMCCTFTATLQKDIAILTSMFGSVEYKLIMGCSVKPKTKCACFENTWGCQKVSITELNSKNNFEVENGKPAFVFDQVMRELHRPTRPRDKESLHTYLCEGTVGTPFVWSTVTSGISTWSNKKSCFSPENKYELRVKSNLILGVSAFNNPLKNAVNGLGRELEVRSFRETDDFGDGLKGRSIRIDLMTTSELAFTKLSAKLKTFFKQVHINYKPYVKTEKLQLHMEELIMEFEDFKCRAYEYSDCLTFLSLYMSLGSENETMFHVSPDLLDLFMTTTSTPAVLLVYTPSHYDETQELCIYLDASLGQSTIKDYTVGMMSETKQHPAGVYYMLYPNSLKECREEVHQCVSKKFGMYLPPAPTANVNKIVTLVFGEQHISRENYHRGNLNKPWFFEPPEEIRLIDSLKDRLQASDYEPELKSDTTSLRVLNRQAYYRTIADKRGNFILFVFRSDMSSLYTIKQILESQLAGILVVECFNLNLICDGLGIKSYPAVFFARNNESLHYTGPLEEGAFKTFRELIEHPVVTVAHRIQVDLVLKGGEKKAAVMISSGNKELEVLFHLACDELYGFVRCYLLDSRNPSEDMIIVHVPDDPVMLNKKYQLPTEENTVQMWVKVLKKLSTPSVISESELLLVYKDLTDYVIFDAVLDDDLATVVNSFPFVQFVQVTSTEFKHKLLKELIGYDYEDAMLFISKSRKCVYKFHEEATLETWVTGALEGSLTPDFKLKDLEGSKYQWQDIYYKNQFKVFEESVRSMRKQVDKLNQNLGRNGNEWKSHQEL